MSILTGPEIRRHVKAGSIIIDPYYEEHLGANSYDLSLSPNLKVYKKSWDYHNYWTRYKDVWPYGHPANPPPCIAPLDMKVEEETCDLYVGEQGQIIFPGILYLAATIECAGSDIFIPCVEGRSSIGRIAVFAHTSAGFGDLGFSGPGNVSVWTLELVAVQPVVVYSNIRVCQVIFTLPEHGKDLGPLPKYKGKYTKQKGPKPSGIWKDFK